MATKHQQTGIVDDFMYGSNVAKSDVSIRLGLFQLYILKLKFYFLSIFFRIS